MSNFTFVFLLRAQCSQDSKLQVNACSNNPCIANACKESFRCALLSQVKLLLFEVMVVLYLLLSFILTKMPSERKYCRSLGVPRCSTIISFATSSLFLYSIYQMGNSTHTYSFYCLHLSFFFYQLINFKLS